jgi:hypothetical protein
VWRWLSLSSRRRQDPLVPIRAGPAVQGLLGCAGCVARAFIGEHAQLLHIALEPFPVWLVGYRLYRGAAKYLACVMGPEVFIQVNERSDHEALFVERLRCRQPVLKTVGQERGVGVLPEAGQSEGVTDDA